MMMQTSEKGLDLIRKYEGLLIPAISNTFSGQLRTLNIHHSVCKK